MSKNMYDMPICQLDLTAPTFGNQWSGLIREPFGCRISGMQKEARFTWQLKAERLIDPAA
jgi:hypothetical protein